jgi:hypothetical protein
VPSAARFLDVERQVDPVIEAYKRDVDRGLLREALKLTPEERIRELIKLQKAADVLREAGERAEREKIP